MATLARRTGIDLWNYKNPQGASIHTALDWLRPYALGEKKWDYQQIGPYNRNEFYPLLLQAATIYSDPKYLTDAAGIQDAGKDIFADLLYRN